MQPVLPDRYVAYLFDDIHLKPGDLLVTRQMVIRHLDESLDRNSRVAVFTTSGKMLINFTDDREKLHAVINSILPWDRWSDFAGLPAHELLRGRLSGESDGFSWKASSIVMPRVRIRIFFLRSWGKA